MESFETKKQVIGGSMEFLDCNYVYKPVYDSGKTVGCVYKRHFIILNIMKYHYLNVIKYMEQWGKFCVLCVFF